MMKMLKTTSAHNEDTFINKTPVMQKQEAEVGKRCAQSSAWLELDFTSGQDG